MSEMQTIALNMLWQWLGMGVTVFLAVVLFLWLWNRRERRKMRYMEIASLLHKWGLDWTAELFEALVVSNYLGKDSVGRKIREVVSVLRTDKAMVDQLEGVAWKVIDYWRKDPGKIAELKERLAGPLGKKS